jgi:uncharacterized protein
MPARIEIDRERLADFCRKRNIRKLSLFGSVLRDDFRPDSDVDVLVEFEPGAPRDLYEFVGIQQELEALVGRDVDLVMESTLRNPIRRRAILAAPEVVYAA